MKISDLLESKKEDYEESLKKSILDVAMLYQSTGATQTDINNLIYELKKAGIEVYREELSEYLKDMGFDVANGKVTFTTKTTSAEDELEDTEGEEYDEVENMAQGATEKRMK